MFLFITQWVIDLINEVNSVLPIPYCKWANFFMDDPQSAYWSLHVNDETGIKWSVEEIPNYRSLTQGFFI
jgi:hypothetical protein